MPGQTLQANESRPLTVNKIVPPKTAIDKNDHSKLRQGRERHEGFDIGQYVQSVPMIFTRDGHNIWLGDMYRGSCAFLILGGPSFGKLLLSDKVKVGESDDGSFPLVSPQQSAPSPTIAAVEKALTGVEKLDEDDELPAIVAKMPKAVK